MSAQRKPRPAPAPPATAAPNLSAYPVRDYVAAMSAELAGMARDDGDRLLAQVLDVAAQMARRPA